MTLNSRTRIYWLSQIGGWGLFVLGNVLSASFQRTSQSVIEIRGIFIPSVYIFSFFIFIVGIYTTHIFRSFAHRWAWSKLNIPALIPRMLLSAFVMSAVFTTFNTIATDLISGDIPLVRSVGEVYFWQLILNFSALFLLWEIIYFAVHVFENWKREEILNLELTASKSEIELNSLKAQINPHFMFNSMNSIRALIDENPEKAKNAITMLSSILRSSLTVGKTQTVTLKEEIDLVEKYLALEKIRFEERLEIIEEIDSEALAFSIPPFMIQTIVENGIKHGISKIIEGGFLKLSVKRLKNHIEIVVINSGEYKPEVGHEGIGLMNTRKRLNLIYHEEASISLESFEKEVRVKIVVPTKIPKNENVSNR